MFIPMTWMHSLRIGTDSKDERGSWLRLWLANGTFKQYIRYPHVFLQALWQHSGLYWYSVPRETDFSYYQESGFILHFGRRGYFIAINKLEN